MSGSVTFSFNANYNSIHGNHLPEVLKPFDLEGNITNHHQEAGKLLAQAKQLESNIEVTQKGSTPSLKGMVLDTSI